MSTKWLAPDGMSIDIACEKALALANIHNEVVYLEFNGIDILCEPNTNPRTLSKAYWDLMALREQKRLEAKDRQFICPHCGKVLTVAEEA